MHNELTIGVNLREELQKYFGHSEFRGSQEEVVKNILMGKDTFVIMPTGAGKSLCYQLPAIISEGTAVVISPLIALMKNQVDQLKGYGINAHFLNSTLNKTESNKVKKEVLSGKTKLLYVAPESLGKEENLVFFRKVNISFLAIDEAHCISEWGHDFRPEYRRIKSIAKELGELPIIALTATATLKVQQDIIRNLGMEDAKLFKSSFRRFNLFYEIRPKTNSKKQLITFINSFKGKVGVIYCSSRKKVEEIAEFLKVNGINASPYHAGMESAERIKNQEDFLHDRVNVIVATIAFGMGIDKPDVRFVIHYDAPKSLEGYYQETGRAGRDGLESKCLFFYSYADILKLEKFSKDKPVTERDNAIALLGEVTSYAESSLCRTRQLLHYFGEDLGEDCGFCDNCKNPKESFEGKDDVKLALETIQQTGQRFGIKHLVDVIRGSANQYVLSYNHNELAVYAKGKDKDAIYWTSVIRQVLINQYLEKDIEEYGVLKLTPKGESFIEKPVSIKLFKDHEYGDLSDDELPTITEKQHDKVLFDLLIQLRNKEAQKHELPPYAVFQEPSLEEMATTYPTTNTSLLTINGVGQGKAKKFGKPFIELIDKYVKENNITIFEDVLVKSTVKKSKSKIQLIQLIDRKMDLEEIAESVGSSYDDLLNEIEIICHSGTKLDIDYYVEAVVGDKEDEIYDYFMEAETDDVDEALDDLGDEFTEEEVRLVRIKFLSEVAN